MYRWIRCQPSRTGGAEPAWRDALAVVTVIVPLILVVAAVANVTSRPPGIVTSELTSASSASS
jgi:hypothetical protein